MALVLSLSILLGVTSTALALLQIGTLEPQISRNLADAARARALADGGLEVAYGRLGRVETGAPAAIVASAVPANPWVTLIRSGTLDDPGGGTYTLRVRNDHDPADAVLTGLPGGAAAGEEVDRDTNGVLIVQSTGTANRAQVTVEAVIRWSADGLSLYNRREIP